MPPVPQPFDPDAPAQGSGIFGLPHTLEEAAVILIPVPWEATVSYGVGTVDGPGAILRASRQVDLFDRETGRPFDAGIAMLPIPEEVRSWSDKARRLALPVIEAGGLEAATDANRTTLAHSAAQVDALGDRLNSWVRETAAAWIDRGRLVGVVGGDHASSFGLMSALAERHPGLGILHLDAHADLRQAYEGFRWSHASIFWNVYQDLRPISRIVQVGVRDYSGSEDQLIQGSGGRLQVFFDSDLRRRLQEGETWGSIGREIVAALPDDVYLSFDIDGLDPTLCPHTGTPVPGGLSFAEAVSLLRYVVESGRRIVGFDLCEVAPDPTGKSEWDANVGARLLYKMIGFALRSREAGHERGRKPKSEPGTMLNTEPGTSLCTEPGSSLNTEPGSTPDQRS